MLWHRTIIKVRLAKYAVDGSRGRRAVIGETIRECPECKGHALGPWTMQCFIVTVRSQSHRLTVIMRCHTMGDYSGKNSHQPGIDRPLFSGTRCILLSSCPSSTKFEHDARQLPKMDRLHI